MLSVISVNGCWSNEVNSGEETGDTDGSDPKEERSKLVLDASET